MCFFNKIFNYQEEKFNTYKILKLKILGISFKIKLLNKINNNIDTKELLDFLYSSDNKDFVKITKYPYVKNEKDTKLIAFYLPQFHTIQIYRTWFYRMDKCYQNSTSVSWSLSASFTY